MPIGKKKITENNPGKLAFNAVIKKTDNHQDAAFVFFPYQVEELFGTKGQVKVKVTIDNCIYRGSLANMGKGGHVLGITKAVRKEIGKLSGDTVKITVELEFCLTLSVCDSHSVCVSLSLCVSLIVSVSGS